MHFCHRCRLGRFDKLAPLNEFVPSSNGNNLCWIIHAYNTKTASRTFCCRTDFLCGRCPCGDKGVSILCRYLPMIDNLDHRAGPSHLSGFGAVSALPPKADITKAGIPKGGHYASCQGPQVSCFQSIVICPAQPPLSGSLEQRLGNIAQDILA